MDQPPRSRGSAVLWTLAWRFTLKQWRRNLLVVGAIALSVFVMVFAGSLLTGVREQFLADTIRQGGHLQVHAAGWSQKTDPESLEPALGDIQGLMAAIRALPGVTEVEPVLAFGAIVMNGGRNLTLEADGIVPSGAAVETVRRHLLTGSLALGPNDVALSRGTARLLDWHAGSDVVLLTQDVDGIPQYRSLHVAAVFDTQNPAYDETHVFVAHATAQDLTNLVGQTLELRVGLSHPGLSTTLQPQVAQLRTPPVEVKTWQETQGSLLVFLKVFDVFMVGIDVLLIIVAAAVITNAILMNFLERISVLSTLRAVGLKDGQTWGLVLREGVLQGILGSLVGLVAGVLVVLPLSKGGLNLGDAAAAIGMGSSVPLLVDAANLLQSFAAGVATAIVAALWAGWTGAKTPILVGLAEE